MTVYRHTMVLSRTAWRCLYGLLRLKNAYWWRGFCARSGLLGAFLLREDIYPISVSLTAEWHTLLPFCSIGRTWRLVNTQLTMIHPPRPGIVHEYLKAFLDANLPKIKEGKKAKFMLGIGDAKLGAQLNELLGVTCEGNEVVQEILRGCVLVGRWSLCILLFSFISPGM